MGPAGSAESQPQQASRMRPERIVRSVCLAVVLLFPLLSLLQLRDTDRPWREAARRTRPVVLALYRHDGAAGALHLATCGLVIQAHPGRVVVPGSVVAPHQSLHGSQRLTWTPLYTDVHGEFTILEAIQGEVPARSHLAAAKLVVDPNGTLLQNVHAALVAPAVLADEPLWVGVLKAGSSAAGRPGYFGSQLTPISATTPFPAAEASAAAPRALAPALRGAPFVDAQGNLVALFLDYGPHGVHALPVEVLAQTLALLHLQAAK